MTEEYDLAVVLVEYDKSQVVVFSLLAKVSAVLFHQNAISVITIECPHVRSGAVSTMQN